MNLPKTLIISSARTIWRTMWLTMMRELAPGNERGEYIRSDSQFRDYPENPAVPQKYHLYVGLSCPWAHRTLIVRALKGLEESLSITVLSPSSSTGGWIFDTKEYNCSSLAQLYRLSQPNYRGKATVPVLWDKQQKKVVNNESSEIIKILNTQFNNFALQPDLDLYPPFLQEEIEIWNTKIYSSINDGVYRCGFARTQSAYEAACLAIFKTLDEIDLILSQKTYLCGDLLTLADVRLFTTLFRFDAVYFGLFKCNLKRIADYTNLSRYVKQIYNLPGIANTCNLEKVKLDYYGQLFPLNPSGIVPLG